MTDEELIARLRDEQPVTQDFQHTLKCALMDAAADRIEALTKERDQWISHAKTAIWSDSEELKETERKLEKAVKLIDLAVAFLEEIAITGEWFTSDMNDLIKELKGESHE